MNIYCFSTLSFAKLQFKSVINKAFHKHGVASFTDAWIETRIGKPDGQLNTVASFTDAWIETGISINDFRNVKSHLLQMRGLKLWVSMGMKRRRMSHLLQMRGLKQLWLYQYPYSGCRIFYRCVDWNCITETVYCSHEVASFTDAWIETNLLWSYAEKPIRRIFYRCVDWNLVLKCRMNFNWVASFTDAWIETVW